MQTLKTPKEQTVQSNVTMPGAESNHKKLMRNIVFTLPDLQHGGGQINILRLADGLSQRGHRVSAVTVWRNVPGTMWDQYEAVFDHVMSLELRRSLLPLAIAKLRRFLSLQRVDIIHATNTYWDLRFGLIGSAITGAPLINTYTSMQFKDISVWWRRFERRITRGRIAYAVGVAPEVLKAWSPVMDEYRIDSLHRTVILNAVPRYSLNSSGVLEARNKIHQELNLSSDNIVVLNLARFVKGKGHVDLVKAFARIVSMHPNARLLLAGDGDLRPEIEALIAKLGIGKYIKLLGHRTDVPDLLASSDLFAFPSYGEGLPLSLLEAMGAGLPVVGYDLPVILQVCPSGKAGDFVPVGNIEGLAELLGRFIGDRTRIERMGAYARRFVEQNHLIEHNVAQHEALYEATLAHWRQPNQRFGL